MNFLTLYHGSKSGIQGRICPSSRIRCDFGRGFYMGTDRSQSLTLICNYPDARIYTLRADLTGLRILNLSADLDWAMLIAWHRGKMEAAAGTPLYERIAHLGDSCDLIVGYIADDRMFVVLDRFFNGEITDTALIHCLSALKLGKQYAAVSQRGCDQIEILDEQVLTQKVRGKLKRDSEENRRKGISLANEICRSYRREGRYFDEILESGE